ncbi:MAG TPA: FtsX-like permease family protein [Dyella sp.]|nr:FtsX-like permease family protein [Dyella sp.]
MEIRPILSTLRRHKITAWLLIMQIALTCAIVCNAIFLIGLRLHHMHMQSGVAEHEVLQVQVADVGNTESRYARAAEDLALLRQIPGVQAVGQTNQVPFAGSSSNANIRLDPDQREPTLTAGSYFGDNISQALGSRLVEGRDFTPSEYVDADVAIKALSTGNIKVLPAIVIITRPLADRLWPGQDPLGKTIYLTQSFGARVIGVVQGLVRANPYKDETSQYSMVLPLHMGVGKDQSYLIRTRPEQRADVLKAAVATLKRADPERVITQQRTLDDIRRDFFQDDIAMAGILVSVCVALLVVNALGIVGLVSFWVAQRRRSIGVRRALGATRANILHYFQTENFLLATMGIGLGMMFAYGINIYLMLHYELPRLPTIYLPVGAVLLWLISQVSVLWPALRAADVPPIVATRSA